MGAVGAGGGNETHQDTEMWGAKGAKAHQLDFKLSVPGGKD